METWGATDNRCKHSFHAYLQKYYTVLQDLYCKPIAHKCFSLIYSISSKHLFTDVSDFGARKKIETWHFQFNFPTTPKQRSSPHPQEDLLKQISHSPGTENSQTPGWGRGMLRFRFDQRIIVWTTKSYEQGFKRSKAVVAPYSKNDSV